MTKAYFGKEYQGNPPANYERFFVPAIGAPLAADLIRQAELRPGERVLDVACGTGVIARLASKQVGETGTIVGLDPNPGMLAVARSVTPPEATIEWHEASAEAMPFPDASFEVVLCQMGLQFVPDQETALKEMHRVLVPGGRLVLNLPGPMPDLFRIMAEALSQHVGAEAAGFVEHVFSLHDVEAIRSLIRSAGFEDIVVEADTRSLGLPEPETFFWQYVQSTPIAGAVAQVDDDHKRALERDVVAKWQGFTEDNVMLFRVRVVVGAARK